MRPLSVPAAALDHRLAILDADRSRGIAIHAGSGSGKSVFMGQVLCFQDLVRGLPQVVLDPHGPLIDNLLLQVMLLEPALSRRLLARIIYVDMSASGGRVVPFPLLQRHYGDGLRDVADRFLEALRKLDPQLQSASIMGWNSLVHVGRPALMIAVALGLPVTWCIRLLRQPDLCEAALRDAEDHESEAAPAVAFIRNEYVPLSQAERLNLARSFLVKLAPFVLDPALSTMFATTDAGIDLADVVANGSCVLLDTRRESNAERRRFKTRWAFEWFMAFVKRRGIGDPVGLGFVVDELTELTNQVALEHDLFAYDLDELINVYGRNYNLFLCLAHQEMFQLPPQTQKTLLTMGTQILGATSDMEAAKYLAEQFFSLDPYGVKRIENVWGSSAYGGSTVVEEREAFIPVDEQILQGAQSLMRLQPFEFLVRQRGRRHLTKVSARRLVEGTWVSEHSNDLAELRAMLSGRVGVARASSVETEFREEAAAVAGIMEGYRPYEEAEDTSEQVTTDYWDTGSSPPEGVSHPNA